MLLYREWSVMVVHECGNRFQVWILGEVFDRFDI